MCAGLLIRQSETLLLFLRNFCILTVESGAVCEAADEGSREPESNLPGH